MVKNVIYPYRLAEGTATVYLPVYHYAFTSYCPALTEQILGKDIELYGKSDARFMESVYKVGYSAKLNWSYRNPYVSGCMSSTLPFTFPLPKG